MASKAQKRRARETNSVLLAELRRLAVVLEAQRLCPDVSPLQRGIGEWSEDGVTGWRYTIDNLLFHRVPIDRCFPMNVLELTCRFYAEVRGFYDVRPTADPLRHVSVEITLEALAADRNKLIHSWHFDRHVGDASKPPGDTEAAHPRYHFHFGGNRMRTFAKENNLNWFPHVILFEGPRPAHPPLDGILAIDFVLSNFFAADWRALRRMPEYIGVVNAAQTRLWKPYANTLPTHWISVPKSESKPEWRSTDCWPNLIGIM